MTGIRNVINMYRYKRPYTYKKERSYSPLQCSICGKFISYSKITKKTNGCCYNDY